MQNGLQQWKIDNLFCCDCGWQPEKRQEEEQQPKTQPTGAAMFKERLMFVIDNMDSITKDPNVSIADRINSERIKLEALAILRDAIKSSISCPDPHSVLE